jgi:very-short-patch-repair endonuclease
MTVGEDRTLPPRWGEGRVGGVAAEGVGSAHSAPNQPLARAQALTPPSPTLPPSRGNGAFEHAAHAKGAIARGRYLRGNMSFAEKKLWAQLRKLKRNIRRQAPIGRFIADFAHHASRLVVEVDSPWHDDEAAQLRDAERDEWLRSQGYRVLRVRGDDVLLDPVGVADLVAQAITNKALPLDGGGLGGGVHSGDAGRMRSTPNQFFAPTQAPAPPSPTLPPSRGKGADLRSGKD